MNQTHTVAAPKYWKDKGDIIMRVRFNTTIEKELLEAVKLEAVRQGKDVNDILEDLLRQYLKGGKNARRTQDQ